MELGCNNCIHKKVCGIQERVNQALEELTLNKVYQDLVKHSIVIKAECPNFMKEGEHNVRILSSNDR